MKVKKSTKTVEVVTDITISLTLSEEEARALRDAIGTLPCWGRGIYAVMSHRRRDKWEKEHFHSLWEDMDIFGQLSDLLEEHKDDPI